MEISQNLTPKATDKSTPTIEAPDPGGCETDLRTRSRMCLNLFRSVGKRYVDCTLANYKCEGEFAEDQRSAVELVRAYGRDLRENLERGRNLVIYGPSGTGKDHLVAALVRFLILDLGRDVNFTSGAEFRAGIREWMKDDCESSYLRTVTGRPLWLSDPIPPRGVLSEWQTESLYRLVDYQSRHEIPIFATINVSGRDELLNRMGSQIAGRLLDDSTAVYCHWPTHRSVLYQRSSPPPERAEKPKF